jgi:tetratricopeptide (TPR) repeat protein
MKKNYGQLALLLFFVTGVSFVIIKATYKQRTENNTVYTLLPRAGNSNNAEWLAAKKNADNLIEKLKAKPGDSKTALALVNAYIIESRISGNIAYYDKAALQMVDNIIEREPKNYEALMLKSLLQLSQHHFAEGLETAKLAVSIDSNSAFIYGLLVDAHVEMGNYNEALAAADKMVSIRPDLRSYSRIAYLREIYGDYPGAISAMKLAVAAGIPAEEATEWCRIQLGRLYENTGQVEKARFQYNLSLAARPNYAYAITGLGGIAAFIKKYDSAIYYYQQAASLMPADLGIKEKLADVFNNAGQKDKAKSLNKALLDEMNKNAKALIDDPNTGHYSDKEQVYVYLQNNNLDKALEHAMAEYRRRPKNIDVNETLAWVYYKRNEIDKALPYINAALITNSKNPALLCTAGLIYLKKGDTAKGKKILALGVKTNPIMMADLYKESNDMLLKYN